MLWRWTAALRAGGQLAVQVPANADHASHQVIEEVAHRADRSSTRSAAAPADPVAVNVLAPECYAELLYSLGYEQQHVRLQVYPHVLASSRGRGRLGQRHDPHTLAGSRLSPELYEEFVARYRQAPAAGARRPLALPLRLQAHPDVGPPPVVTPWWPRVRGEALGGGGRRTHERLFTDEGAQTDRVGRFPHAHP